MVQFWMNFVMSNFEQARNLIGDIRRARRQRRLAENSQINSYLHVLAISDILSWNKHAFIKITFYRLTLFVQRLTQKILLKENLTDIIDILPLERNLTLWYKILIKRNVLKTMSVVCVNSFYIFWLKGGGPTKFRKMR